GFARHERRGAADAERILDLEPRRLEVGEAALEVLGQRAHQQRADARRRALGEKAVVGLGEERGLHGVQWRAREGALAAQAFEEQAAEGETVGARILRL